MGTKIVYNKSNGIEVLAYEDQVTAGLFHLPAGSTEVKPPSFNTETHTCKFIDDDLKNEFSGNYGTSRKIF